MTTKEPALLLIDIQHDFLPGGALAVNDGDAIIAPVKQIASLFSTIIVTQDWHPAGHKSFASSHLGRSVYEEILWQGYNQTLWPDHCVQGSYGAKIHPEILGLQPAVVIQKGTNPEIDSYSAFFDNHHLQETPLKTWLASRGIMDIVVAGLATDYCVLFSVLDALDLGLEVGVFLPGIRGVNLEKEDSIQAKEQMKNAGAVLFSDFEAVRLWKQGNTG